MAKSWNAKAYAAAGPTASLAPITIARRDPAERDVQIEILFCGICHSDLHTVRNEWSEFMPTVYPCVPAMRSSAGSRRSARLSPNSRPEISLRSAAWSIPIARAPSVKAGLEQFCPNLTLTYNSPDTHLGGVTYGGYSDASSSMNVLFSASLPSSISPARRRCFVRGSRRIRPCAIGASPKARKSASSASAGWATWR